MIYLFKIVCVFFSIGILVYQRVKPLQPPFTEHLHTQIRYPTQTCIYTYIVPLKPTFLADVPGFFMDFSHEKPPLY